MFGYATNETPVLMPAPIHYAHKLVERQAKVRKGRNPKLPWLRPDAKSQLTFATRTTGRSASRPSCSRPSTRRTSGRRTLREGVMEEIIKPVLPEALAQHAARSSTSIRPAAS